MANLTGDLLIKSCISTFFMSGLAFDQGDHALARTWVLQGLEGFERLNKNWGIARSHEQLGFLAFEAKNYDEARYHFGKVLATQRKFGMLSQAVGAMLSLSEIRIIHKEDSPGVVALLVGILHNLDTGHWAREEAEKLCTRLEAELNPDIYKAAWERGKTLKLEDVVTELLSE